MQIESLPFQDFIPRFDRPTTLFFCDPPYWKRKLYNYNFSEEDYRTLADLLQSIKGKFVLTVDDVPELREMFKPSNITEVEIPYTAQREAGKRYRELIITNFDCWPTESSHEHFLEKYIARLWNRRISDRSLAPRIAACSTSGRASWTASRSAAASESRRTEGRSTRVAWKNRNREVIPGPAACPTGCDAWTRIHFFDLHGDVTPFLLEEG